MSESQNGNIVPKMAKLIYSLDSWHCPLSAFRLISESESESYVAGAHCVLSRHGERFAWVVKREKIVRLLQSSLKGCEGRRQFYIRW